MNTHLLYPASTKKLSLRDKIVLALQQESELPAFRNTTRKLLELSRKPNVHLDEITAVASLDPAIAGKFLKAASSPTFSGKNIINIHEALLIIGMEEIRKLCPTIVLLNHLQHLKVKVNWELFWLHSILTARLTELLADAYRETDGKEYLAGLLHDAGKLFLEHLFPPEFELVVLRAMMTNQGMHEAESKLLDITHAEVGAFLCEKWQVHPEVIHAIRHHHEPRAIVNKDPGNSKNEQFLPLCVFLANTAANFCHANIQGAEKFEDLALTQIPEWKLLKEEYVPRKTLMLDMEAELLASEKLLDCLREPGSSPRLSILPKTPGSSDP